MEGRRKEGRTHIALYIYRSGEDHGVHLVGDLLGGVNPVHIHEHGDLE